MSTKILICTHKEFNYIPDNSFLPIHVGKEISAVDLPYQVDNTGTNISSKNKNYCELTALYWAWKNLEHWWSSEHWDIKGCRTLWQPQQKKIWFTELGFPSIDKATNQPNIFFNPDCCDGGVPRFSDGSVDYDVQKKGLVASLKAIEKISKAEIKTTIRWQPYIPNVSELTDKFVQKVANVGVKHIGFEHLKLPLEKDHI
jgi:hypothetical protein